MADYFKENGAAKVTHALIRPLHSDITKAKEILQFADIIFISGGDVEYGIKVLKEKKMADFLFKLYTAGKPFFGVSAGSIMLGKEWVKWSDPDNADSAELFPCLGIAPVICDTHGEEDDFEELQAALRLEKIGTEGYGIVSGTAIKVYYNGTVEAVGGNSYRYVHRGDKVERIADLAPLK
jgi:peptidase E